MFYGCSGLVSLPCGFLPVTTLAQGCYLGMFTNCSGLTALPGNLLPATTLVNDCYVGTFFNCTNLASIGTINAAWFSARSSNKQEVMFGNCNKITSPIAYVDIPKGWK
jgi:hypothetical protein